MKTIYDDGTVIMNRDETYHFIDIFNRDSGFQITGNTPDGTDPFMREFPSLIDVGVMGHCEHGRSGLCVAAGVQCYQEGLTVRQPHMSLDDFKRIVEEIKGKVYQVALGGRGDPNKHPDFGELLMYARQNGVVPNYTTSGLALTDAEVALTAELCGAVAVSWYRSDYTLSAIQRFVDAGCITNIHYVLGNNSIDEATDRLTNGGFPDVNAIIFLLHKPVGQGSSNNVLHDDDPRLTDFFALIDDECDYTIGFDSCSIPGILNHTQHITPESIDTCEGARFSMYISPDMKATPCSFDQSMRYSVSLCDHTIQDAWNSNAFNAFRSKLRDSCPDCALRTSCYGGCPLTPEIVLCGDHS